MTNPKRGEMTKRLYEEASYSDTDLTFEEVDQALDEARQEGWKAGMEEAAGICESDDLYDDYASAAAVAIRNRLHTDTL